MLPRLDERAAIVLLCNGALSVAESLGCDALPRDAVLLAATSTHGAWLERPAADDPDAHPDARHVVHAGNGETWVGPLLPSEGSSAGEAGAAAAVLRVRGRPAPPARAPGAVSTSLPQGRAPLPLRA